MALCEELSTAGAPSAADIWASTATYKYTIDTTPIKVFLAYNMDGKLFNNIDNIPKSIANLQNGTYISRIFNVTRLNRDTNRSWTVSTDATRNATYPVNSTFTDELYTVNRSNPYLCLITIISYHQFQ